MDHRMIKRSRAAAALTAVLLGAAAQAQTTVQIGPSGKTYASAAVRCMADPVTRTLAPAVEAGLFNPKRHTSATVSLDGQAVATVTAEQPATEVRFPVGAVGDHSVTVALSRKVADNYRYTVPAGSCDASGNVISADGTLEYGASGKSYATVTPGCAYNAATGQAQPYVHLFDNGGFVLNVSVNGTPLTQLSATRPHVPVFLRAGLNVIAVANGSLSTDYYVRDGGQGVCTLP